MVGTSCESAAPAMKLVPLAKVLRLRTAESVPDLAKVLRLLRNLNLYLTFLTHPADYLMLRLLHRIAKVLRLPRKLVPLAKVLRLPRDWYLLRKCCACGPPNLYLTLLKCCACCEI